MLFGFRAAGLRFSSTFGAVLCGVFVGRLITPGTSRNDGVQWLAAMVNWSATSCTVVAAIQWLKNLWITCVVKKYWTVSFRLVYHATCIKAVVERYSSLLRSFSSIFMLGSWNFKLMYSRQLRAETQAFIANPVPDLLRCTLQNMIMDSNFEAQFWNKWKLFLVISIQCVVTESKLKIMRKLPYCVFGEIYYRQVPLR